MTPASPTHRPAWYAPTLAGILYFSQGLPFGIVIELLPLYMRLEKISLAEIGALSAVTSAWTWKFLWSPLVDRFGSYRRWMTGALLVLATTYIGLAFVPPQRTAIYFTIAAILAIASATQDIAIDAMVVRITPRHQLGYVNSVRVMTYRGAMIVAGSAFAIIGDKIGWKIAFLVAAAITLVLLTMTFFLPRETGEPGKHENPFIGIVEWLKQPYAGAFLAIAFIYRMGDAALSTMVKPFWVDKGYSGTEIGSVTTAVGLSCLIAGAFAGGAFLSRFGIWRALLWLGALQVLSNAGYAIAAAGSAPRPMFYTVVIIENFTSGLGTAAFLAFLMAICNREHAATQFAMLSAAFALTRFAVGTVSGFLAEAMGYGPYFWLTMALGIPGLLLVPLIRKAQLLAPPTKELVADV